MTQIRGGGRLLEGLYINKTIQAQNFSRLDLIGGVNRR